MKAPLKYLPCCCSVIAHVQLFATLWTAAHQASGALRYLPEFAQTHVYWVHDTIQPSHLLPSPSPPASIFPSIRVFSIELALHIRWQKYWSFSFRISSSSEYSGLVSFRIDWLHLLLSKGLSWVFYSTTIQKHQFFGVQPSSWSNCHITAWLLEKP